MMLHDLSHTERVGFDRIWASILGRDQAHDALKLWKLFNTTGTSRKMLGWSNRTNHAGSIGSRRNMSVQMVQPQTVPPCGFSLLPMAAPRGFFHPAEPPSSAFPPSSSSRAVSALQSDFPRFLIRRLK